jgi:ankyrin repeat protein
MFISLAERTNQQSNDLFEALDLGESSHNFFKEKCKEFPNELLVTLRDIRVGQEGRTLLHNAARIGHLSAALHLIRAGHSIDVFDSNLSRVTPLMDAIMSKHIELAIILVESGASLFTQDINLENSLHYGARSGSSRMIKWMIKAANLTKEQIQECASASNIKLKFPEDLADSPLSREVLTNLRQFGFHAPLFKRKKSLTY